MRGETPSSKRKSKSKHWRDDFVADKPSPRSVTTRVARGRREDIGVYGADPLEQADAPVGSAVCGPRRFRGNRQLPDGFDEAPLQRARTRRAVGGRLIYRASWSGFVYAVFLARQVTWCVPAPLIVRPGGTGIVTLPMLAAQVPVDQSHERHRLIFASIRNHKCVAGTSRFSDVA